MKKALIITACCLVIIGIGICLLVFRNRYDIVKFSVEQEPDGVFISRFSDELFMIVDGEIRAYDENGSYDIWDININVRSIFPYEDELWLIDQNNDLYRYSSGASTLVLNDVVDFYTFNESHAAVSGSGELYVWGDNSYLGAGEGYSEEPVLVENISGAKRVKISNFFVLLLDKEGQLYECSMLVDESQRGFKKIEGLEPIREIYSGYGTIAVADSGKTYYWFKSFNSGAVNPSLDDTSVIESICDELRVKNYSLGAHFWAGCTERGEVCWWGDDTFRESYTKSIHSVRSPEKIPYIKNAENVYSGAFVMYIKSGTDFYIVRSVL